MNNNCVVCHIQLQPEWYFCPNCGKVIKEKPPSISFFKQIMIYFVSFFLAPLGLVWGIKYVRNQNIKVKIVGVISILLTVVSIFMMIVIFKNFIEQYSKMLNNFGVGSFY